jgi:hypothetical protein
LGRISSSVMPDEPPIDGGPGIPDRLLLPMWQLFAAGPPRRERLPAMPADIQIEPLTEQVRRTLAQERMVAAGTSFGTLALSLAAVGRYGLLAYLVARSMSEMGIRIALRAKRGAVLGWVSRLRTWANRLRHSSRHSIRVGRVVPCVLDAVRPHTHWSAGAMGRHHSAAARWSDCRLAPRYPRCAYRSYGGPQIRVISTYYAMAASKPT